ncbi:MAG: DUF2594 family protein [Candidatus Malihini olakiniferum]
MSNVDFSTGKSVKTLADEVTCLKAMITLLLKAIGQADAGKVIINMEKQIALIDDLSQAEVFYNTLKQIKYAYH